MRFKNLEDKCQYYRGLTDYRLLPNRDILVMLDGKNFSKLIKNNFKKPFDDDFIDMMNKTAQFLCENVQGCKFAYTQSDEISLLITDYETTETDTLFGGRLCKIQSILASLATSEFNRQFILYNIYHGDKRNIGAGDCVDIIEKMKMAQFDCKAWVVPSQNDAFAWFLYRQLDCVKNSKQQTAQTYLPHKQLVGHNADEQIQMVAEKNGIDWYAFDNKYKYGRFVYKVEKQMTTTLPSGETIEYTRNKFTPVGAWDLTTEEGKIKFIEHTFKFEDNE